MSQHDPRCVPPALEISVRKNVRCTSSSAQPSDNQSIQDDALHFMYQLQAPALPQAHPLARSVFDEHLAQASVRRSWCAPPSFVVAVARDCSRWLSFGHGIYASYMHHASLRVLLLLSFGVCWWHNGNGSCSLAACAAPLVVYWGPCSVLIPI